MPSPSCIRCQTIDPNDGIDFFNFSFDKTYHSPHQQGLHIFSRFSPARCTQRQRFHPWSHTANRLTYNAQCTVHYSSSHLYDALFLLSLSRDPQIQVFFIISNLRLIEPLVLCLQISDFIFEFSYLISQDGSTFGQLPGSTLGKNNSGTTSLPSSHFTISLRRFILCSSAFDGPMSLSYRGHSQPSSDYTPRPLPRYGRYTNPHCASLTIIVDDLLGFVNLPSNDDHFRSRDLVSFASSDADPPPPQSSFRGSSHSKTRSPTLYHIRYNLVGESILGDEPIAQVVDSQIGWYFHSLSPNLFFSILLMCSRVFMREQILRSRSFFCVCDVILSFVITQFVLFYSFDLLARFRMREQILRSFPFLCVWRDTFIRYHPICSFRIILLICSLVLHAWTNSPFPFLFHCVWRHFSSSVMRTTINFTTTVVDLCITYILKLKRSILPRLKCYCTYILQ
jgi:hypothetical protein